MGQVTTAASAPTVADTVAPLVGGCSAATCRCGSSSGTAAHVGPPSRRAPGTLRVRSPDALRRILWRPERARPGPGLRGRRPRRRRRPVRAARRRCAGDPRGHAPRLVGAPGRRSRAAAHARPAAPAAAAAARGGAARGRRHSRASRRRGHQPPLRRRQRLLPARARPVDDLLVRPLRSTSASTSPTAQAAKHELICRKLGLPSGPARACSTSAAAGARWPSTPPRHHDVSVVGITISRAQADAGPQAGRRGRRRRPGRDPAPGLPRARRRALRRHLVDRHVRARRRRAAGRVLRHPARRPAPAGPAAQPRHQLASAARRIGRTVVHRPLRVPRRRADRRRRRRSLAMEPAGFEVRDVESLREHYARTLRAWVANLEARLGRGRRARRAGRARVWRLYMAGSAVGFEDGGIDVHQVLGVVPADDGGERDAGDPPVVGRSAGVGGHGAGLSAAGRGEQGAGTRRGRVRSPACRGTARP